MSFRLSGEIKDKELFKEIISAGVRHGGRLFYRRNEEGNIIEPVYFSGEKRIIYTGEVDQELASVIESSGFRVDTLRWYEDQGILEIVQR